MFSSDIARQYLAIRHARHDSDMLIARIVCSDPACTEELEVTVESLDELERFLCDCGHGFVLLTVSELAKAGKVLSLPRRGPAWARRAA
jgi:hypothetical protein